MVNKPEQTKPAAAAKPKYNGEERRKDWHTPDSCPMQSKLMTDSERIDRIEAELAENTAATKEMLEILTMGKGFFKTVGVIGFAIKWCAGIAVAVFAAYQAYKNGAP